MTHQQEVDFTEKSDVGGHLKEHASMSHSRPLVTVTALNVSYNVAPPRLGPKLLPCMYVAEERETNITGTPYKHSDGVELLQDMTFIAKPNELTAIMGPSGCGKTTFEHFSSESPRPS
eukprot:Blabericola_migrator_1__10377@NODE_585_length_7468_cov_222_283070_g432_i0_p6_GENE_NODE_585_length_7468_cov_222_283070_g432_i0NODE_585_length_7468_cov_222_283070_g432_i0_p6_ORF_typecomplete_len118_score14_35ABC_tran/PF00005_27/1_4e05AAA_29/PF13555_6/0_0016DnaB_C/PF03796_15/0_027Rad17/PF03215_15/0_039ATPase_2/PF01637_18/0_057IPT/PF01745_16/0_092AAA_30/PF13604_6/0_088Pox_A32/PF04665_12/0_078AAA_23/PF13476_6/0_1Rad51/PF08423_11/0_17AAA_24/PF13479_6/0_21AAA_33/PF13671_6/0_2AAA_25/PF13481_6/0_22T2SSE/